MRINPIHVCEGPAAYMMINADQEAIFQTFQPGAVDAIAFQNNRRLIITVDPIGLQHLIGEREGAINPRHSVVQHHIGLLSHGAQYLATSQRRSNGIPIRPRVRV